MALSEKNIRNIIIYSVPKFAHYGLNLISLPILTRLLTPSDFGIIALAWTFPAIAANLFSVGIIFGAERYYFEYRKDKQKIYSLMFMTQMFLYITFLFSGLIIYYVQSNLSKFIAGNAAYGPAFFWIFIAGYLTQINSFYFRIYQNMEKAVIHSIFTFMQPLIGVTLSIVLIRYFEFSYMGIAYGQTFGALIVTICMIIHFNKDTKRLLNINMLFDNIKYGIQLVPKSVSGFINRFFDKYMLNRILSESAVGVYSIGQNIGNAVGMAMNVVWSALQPVYYREVFDNGNEASPKVGRIFTIFAYTALIPIIVVVLFAQEIVYILAPSTYYEAINIIVIISAGMATQIFGIYCGVQYAYSKKAYWIFPITVVGTVGNVIANIVLIPKFGLIGAGLSTVLTLSLTNGLIAFVGQKLYRIEYERATIVSLLLIIYIAAFAVIFMRVENYGALIVYPIKFAVVCIYIIIGVVAGLINKNTINKISDSILVPFVK